MYIYERDWGETGRVLSFYKKNMVLHRVVDLQERLHGILRMANLLPNSSMDALTSWYLNLLHAWKSGFLST